MRAKVGKLNAPATSPKDRAADYDMCNIYPIAAFTIFGNLRDGWRQNVSE